MITKNPFPGMNPFFEQRWRDAHTMLIAYIRDALQELLPPDLIAGAEEEAVTVGASQLAQVLRPDVHVSQPWTLKDSGQQVVEAAKGAGTATEPIRVFIDEEITRWVEIRDETGRLITVLELLSPSNKTEAAERDRYRTKRRTFLSGGVNVVEIDLVRQGISVFPDKIRETLRNLEARYGVAVFRATQPWPCEVYPIRLRDRLPAIRVPLRPADPDVVLDLQPLIDQCHVRGRYHLLNYRCNLEPPLPPEEAAWMDGLLREHGLR